VTLNPAEDCSLNAFKCPVIPRSLRSVAVAGLVAGAGLVAITREGAFPDALAELHASLTGSQVAVSPSCLPLEQSRNRFGKAWIVFGCGPAGQNPAGGVARFEQNAPAQSKGVVQ
jgi:hypothetical protein